MRWDISLQRNIAIIADERHWLKMALVILSSIRLWGLASSSGKLLSPGWMKEAIKRVVLTHLTLHNSPAVVLNATQSKGISLLLWLFGCFVTWAGCSTLATVFFPLRLLT